MAPQQQPPRQRAEDDVICYHERTCNEMLCKLWCSNGRLCMPEQCTRMYWVRSFRGHHNSCKSSCGCGGQSSTTLSNWCCRCLFYIVHCLLIFIQSRFYFTFLSSNINLEFRRLI